MSFQVGIGSLGGAVFFLVGLCIPEKSGESGQKFKYLKNEKSFKQVKYLKDENSFSVE